MKKKILVTGSTGYLGSYLVKRLLDNYRVIGLDIVKRISEEYNLKLD